jgi:hypothetical protein
LREIVEELFVAIEGSITEGGDLWAVFMEKL